MFSLFGKKTIEKKTQEQAADQAIKENLDKEIVVHVMPKLFLNAHTNAKKAKSTGILILITGSIFLIAACFGFYYFIFKFQPASKVPGLNSTSSTSSAVEPAIAPATGTEAEIPASSSQLMNVEAATTTASTSQEMIVASSSDSGLNQGSVKDSDQDGLTDNEEVLLGTDINKQDTDGDGYNDLVEVIKLFNPTGAGKISADSKIKIYTNDTFGYSFDYPSAWVASAFGDNTIKIGPAIQAGSADVTASSTDNANSQFIQVNVAADPKNQTIDDWYKEQFNLTELEPGSLVEHLDQNGQVQWQGIKNQDGLTVYFTDKNNQHIYTINYDISSGSTVDFPNLFNLMIGSFNLRN